MACLLEGQSRVSVCLRRPSFTEGKKEGGSLLSASVPVPKFGDAVERFAAADAIKNRRGGAEQRREGGRQWICSGTEEGGRRIEVITFLFIASIMLAIGH